MEIKSLKAASSLPSVPSVDEGKPLRPDIVTSRNYKLLKAKYSFSCSTLLMTC